MMEGGRVGLCMYTVKANGLHRLIYFKTIDSRFASAGEEGGAQVRGRAALVLGSRRGRKRQ